MRALIIMPGPMKNILDGNKTWEIRGMRTHLRERIALIQSKSGLIVGVSDLVDCLGPLTQDEMLANVSKHRITKEALLQGKITYKQVFAWVLQNARRLDRPVPYKHPSGA